VPIINPASKQQAIHLMFLPQNPCSLSSFSTASASSPILLFYFSTCCCYALAAKGSSLSKSSLFTEASSSFYLEVRTASLFAMVPAGAGAILLLAIGILGIKGQSYCIV